MIQTNWCVITGAPSSGKTTLIHHLSQMGYRTAPEVARNYIRHLLIHNHSTLSEIKNNTLDLQRKILTIMLERERQLPAKDPIFFDRGIPDSAAYFRYHHLDDQHVINACRHQRYKRIFYCHGLPVVRDAVRDEDDLAAKRIGELIYDVYIELGYKLIELPAVSVEERMKIILSQMDAELK